MKAVKKVLAGAVLAGGVLMASAANAFWGPWDWFDDDNWWDDYPPPWVLYGPYGPYGYYGAPYYGYGYPGWGAYPYAYPYGGYAYPGYPGYTYPTQQAPATGSQQKGR